MDRELRRLFFFSPSDGPGLPFEGQPLEEGYLANTGSWEIRLSPSKGRFQSTLKEETDSDRREWEFLLDAPTFQDLWDRTEGQRVSMVRQQSVWKGHTLEVNRYTGALEGLSIASIDFTTRAQARAFSPPRSWGPELTYDPRFQSRNLARSPGEAPRTPPKMGAPGWSFGVLPFRLGPRGWELIVVSTRNQDRWIFPKGQPEPGQSPQKVALTEAREEAGITGKVAGHPLVLPYPRETGTTNLLLFPLLVTGLADRWLERGQRERHILPLTQAGAYGAVVASGARWLQHYAEVWG